MVRIYTIVTDAQSPNHFNDGHKILSRVVVDKTRNT